MMFTEGTKTVTRTKGFTHIQEDCTIQVLRAKPSKLKKDKMFGS